MTKMFNFGIFFLFNYVTGNYLGFEENRLSGVCVKNKKIAGRVSQNETFGLSLSFSPHSLFPSFFFTVFSVARPTFLCLQVTL